MQYRPGDDFGMNNIVGRKKRGRPARKDHDHFVVTRKIAAKDVMCAYVQWAIDTSPGLDRSEIARKIDISERTLYNYIKLGKVKLPGKDNNV